MWQSSQKGASTRVAAPTKTRPTSVTIIVTRGCDVLMTTESVDTYWFPTHELASDGDALRSAQDTLAEAQGELSLGETMGMERYPDEEGEIVTR